MENEMVKVRSVSMNTSSSEAFKTLRTNLIYSEGVHVITITSTIPNEGKTATAFHLARTFAEMDKRVLLIDADLRKGSLRKYFAVKHRPIGLSEALTRQSGQIIVETTIPNLDMVFSGKVPPNPTELLSTNTFDQILNRIKQAYDYVIIDTPPMSVSMDAAITGRASDGVVLVCRNDFVKKAELRKAKVQLERNGARVIGCVLNRVKKDQVDYSNYGYSYYYEDKE